MVVAAGTAHDPRQFWTTVADILRRGERADRVVLEYTDRWGTGTAKAPSDATGADGETERWRDGTDRYVRAHVAPHIADRARLQLQLATALELAGLVGRRAVLEHERRLGTFLIELARWMRTVATDPRQLLQYTVHSVMTLTGAHGAVVVERGADGALRVVAAAGLTEALSRQPADLEASILARAMAAESPLLVDVLGEVPDLPVAPDARASLAAAMLVPLPTTGGAAGALAIYRVADQPRGRERFSLQDVAYLQAVASHIGGALELAWAIRAAQQAAHRASAMVNGSPLPLALVDRQGHVLEANRAWADLFGLEELERIRGQHLDAFAMTLDRASPVEALELAASGVPWRGRAVAMRRDEERKCELFVTPLDGMAAEFLLALHDRTEEIRARRELVAREKLATVGTIAAGVAHEVNNPLAAARMEAELLAMQGASPEVAAASAAIIREVDRAARIAKSLLRLATQSHGQMQDIMLAQVLQDIVAVRGPLLRESGIELRLESPAEPPAVFARGGDVDQILLHILANAEDAVRGRHPAVITLSAEALGAVVRVAIDDSGPGVAPEHRARIFDPFFTTKPPDKATGLGLAMCFRIVSEIGGKIWVEDSPIGGARFIVELPRTAV